MVESSYYLSLFLDESRDKLQHVGQLLIELEREPSDAERVAHVFREIHSFKGNADTMGFADMTELAHAMEHVLDGLRLGALESDVTVMRLLGRALVALELRLADVEADKAGQIAPELVHELEAIASRFERPVCAEPVREAAFGQLAGPRVSERSRTYRLEITLESTCFIKGTRAFMITTALEMLGSVLDVTPSLEELDWPEAGNTFQVLLLTDAEPQALRAGLADIGEIEKIAIAEQAEGPARAMASGSLTLTDAEREELERQLDETRAALVVSVGFMPQCRMPGARALLALNALADLGAVIKADPAPDALEETAAGFKVLVASAVAPDALRDALYGVTEVLTVSIETWEGADEAQAIVPAAPLSIEQRLPGVASFPAETGDDGPGGRRARTLRVSAERLDDLGSLVERLFEANSRLARLAHARDHGSGTLAEAAADAAELADALREELARLRRVPIEAVFSRYPRMVRELAHELGKQVSLQQLGGDIEVDRALADELGDMLVHLLRNAVDHGLETPAERHATGKGASGTLQLAARREGGNLVITVADDGRGVDPRRIAAVAVQRGRLSPAEVERLDDEALLEMIFDPGFSTAPATTRISGRGVGLDAVKSKAEALGGRLTVESITGRGTIFQLRFPVRADQAPRSDERVGA